MDIREIPREDRERFINEDVLAKLPPHQADLVKRTMVSEEWRQAESAVRLDELEKENRRLQARQDESERVLAEFPKLKEKVKAAEKAQAAAERVAVKERIARKSAEAEIEELISAVRAASQEQSRLDRLVEQLDR